MKNYCSTMIRPPTAARPTEHQHWCPPHHATTPATPSSGFPHSLSGGTRICCAPGSLTPHSSFKSTPYPFPCSLSHILFYGSTTMLMTPPSLFSTSGNPVVRSISLLNLSIVVKTTPAPPLPFSPYHLRPDHDDNARTVHFVAQDAHPFDDHPHHALLLFLCLQCSLQ